MKWWSASFLMLTLLGCRSEGEMQPPLGMTLVPGGTFMMGDNDGLIDERPAHSVTVDGFLMDTHEVTNDQFAKFVKETGYKTVAERPLDPNQFPGVPKEKLRPGGLVISKSGAWEFVAGANWMHPEGPRSSLVGKGRHPVVQIAWEDAMAYAKWVGKSLPTEAQWEYAARADGQFKHIWGDNEFDDSNPPANIWQGQFPLKNDNTDGYLTTAPVGAFPANKFGLHDMAGNVWEWCSDWYRPDAYKNQTVTNPMGPANSFDPAEPETPKRVLRGGSFLCAECYCRGYRPSARMKSSPDTGLMHAGFRCVINIEARK